MRNLIVMFVTAVCFLFLLKLKWPKNKNIYDASYVYLNINLSLFVCIGPEKPRWGVTNYVCIYALLLHGRHICAPQKGTNMASPYKAL